MTKTKLKALVCTHISHLTDKNLKDAVLPQDYIANLMPPFLSFSDLNIYGVLKVKYEQHSKHKVAFASIFRLFRIHIKLI